MRLCLLLLTFSLPLFAQLETQEFAPDPDDWQPAGTQKWTATVPLVLNEDAPFYAWSLLYPAPAANTNMGVRFSHDGTTWTTPQSVRPDAHATRADCTVSELNFYDQSYAFAQIVVTFPTSLADFELRLVNPGHSRAVDVADHDAHRECPQPNYLTRADWCPAGDCPPHPNPAATAPTHLIVHHSAGTNSSSDWAAVVRAIWDFHVNTNGWADVGYNWLVDPNGLVYEGRGANVIGAHFCGTNGQTEGICVLGNFTATAPQPAAVGALVDLLGWRSGELELTATETGLHSSSGLDLHRVSGHRDGCATACPGEVFYDNFEALRLGVEDWKTVNCNAIPELPAPADLAAEIVGSNLAELTWTDASDNELYFRIERSPDAPDAFGVVDSVFADVEIWTDPALEPDRTYFYRLQAVNADTVSAYSNEAEVTTLVSNVGEASADFNWSVFPNPARTTVIVRHDLPRSPTLEVYDVTGRLVAQQSIGRRATISVAEFPAGIYQLRLTDGVRSDTRRLVIR